MSQILTAVEEQGIVPFSDLDIKRLRGEWEGSYRLRVGKVRVVFTVNFDSTDIEIYAVGFREDIYKQKLR